MTRREWGWARLLVVVAALAAAGVASCSSTGDCGVTKTGNPSNSCDDLPGIPGGGTGATGLALLKPVAKACGIDVDCKAAGVLEGNTSISGVASVDSFLAAVERFRAQADHQAAELNAQIAAIRAAFGIDASANLELELKARFATHLEGELRVEAAVTSCKTTAEAAVAAKARCEGTVMPPKPEVECRGRCELSPDRSFECAAQDELVCTFTAAASECAGECKGRCAGAVTSAAACAGVCRGTCTGSCSQYADAAASECAGRCDGLCTGSCEVELAQGGRCDGACSGECALARPDRNCEGALSASCSGPASASVPCEGRCDGDVEPPRVRAECEATTRAEAKLSVQCSPPRVTLQYRLKSDLDPEARARFELAMQALQQRLPSLLAALARAYRTVEAGTGLTAGVDAVERVAERAEDVAADGDLRAAFGLYCAGGQAAKIPGVLETSADKLAAAVSGAAAVRGALGLN